MAKLEAEMAALSGPGSGTGQSKASSGESSDVSKLKADFMEEMSEVDAPWITARVGAAGLTAQIDVLKTMEDLECILERYTGFHPAHRAQLMVSSVL